MEYQMRLEWNSCLVEYTILNGNWQINVCVCAERINCWAEVWQALNRGGDNDFIIKALDTWQPEDWKWEITHYTKHTQISWWQLVCAYYILIFEWQNKPRFEPMFAGWTPQVGSFSFDVRHLNSILDRHLQLFIICLFMLVCYEIIWTCFDVALASWC